MVGAGVRGGRGEGGGKRGGWWPVQRFVCAEAPMALPPFVFNEQQDVSQGEARVALAAGQQVLVPF